MTFQPDYRHVIAAVQNRRPARLPLYEHGISAKVAGEIMQRPISSLLGSKDPADLREGYRLFCEFHRQMTYDTVSYEVGIASLLPGHGAIMGGMIGPIQSRSDFEKYPWQEVERRFYETAELHMPLLGAALPEGMKLVGGCGYGVLEISEDLVGYEPLCYMLLDDAQLVAELFRQIGQLMMNLWRWMLERFGQFFAVCRFGDDLGFKTATLLSPPQIRQYIVPQYRRLIAQIHAAGKPFLFHSCGRIFDVMDDIIEAGIDAKHSNEDAIAPFDEWIRLYGKRIGLAGGIDVDVLCRHSSDEVYRQSLEMVRRFRQSANGYLAGSGNTIAEYVPAENFLAMVRAVQEVRREEGTK